MNPAPEGEDVEEPNKELNGEKENEEEDDKESVSDENENELNESFADKGRQSGGFGLEKY